MRILALDTTILAAPNQFRTLIPGDLAANIHCLFFGFGPHRGASVILASNLPSTLGVGRHILIFTF